MSDLLRAEFLGTQPLCIFLRAFARKCNGAKDKTCAMKRILPSRSPSEHDAANAELSFRFVRALAVEKAALDRTLLPSCTFILAAITHHMNAQTKRAWPGYQAIAALTGYSEDVIDKSIRALKRAGYLFTERRAPVTGGRALVHYGLGSIHPSDIDEMITAAVEELRRRESTKADPAEKSGVRAALTPPKIAGSKPHPAKFSASDPADFNRQKPSIEEPIKKKGACASFALIAEEEFDEFHRLFHVWGREDSQTLSTLGRHETDTLLRREISAHSSVDPNIVRSAFLVALNSTTAKSHQNCTKPEPRVAGGNAMLAYFRQCLLSNIQRFSGAPIAKRTAKRARSEERHVGHWWANPNRVAEITDQYWIETIGTFANGIWSIDKLGPPPGHPKCIVPRHIAMQLQIDHRWTAQGDPRTQ